MCGIFHTLCCTVLWRFQVFPHGIGMVRNVHATFTQNLRVELSQGAKWMEGEVSHSGNLLLAPKGSLPTMGPPPRGRVPFEELRRHPQF